MAVKNWEPLKIRFCDHAGCDVTLEVEVVYAAGILSDQPPRLLAHRCSNGVECSLEKQASCVWAGTNPAYDPFMEK
ncbi:MAG: hypothetical protein IMZ61_01070 [Planctomycetes bacterium]|nr:hypothetical protein [Planctomycetota bacterium]